MSFWTRLGVTVQDLGCFRRACEQNDVEFVENEDQNFNYRGRTVVATIKDRHGSGYGYLVRDGGALRVMMDVDPNYNTIVARLGKNGGRLGRDYSEMVIRKEVRKRGGMVTRTAEEANGWRTIYVGVK